MQLRILALYHQNGTLDMSFGSNGLVTTHFDGFGRLVDGLADRLQLVLVGQTNRKYYLLRDIPVLLHDLKSFHD